MPYKIEVPAELRKIIEVNSDGVKIELSDFLEDSSFHNTRKVYMEGILSDWSNVLEVKKDEKDSNIDYLLANFIAQLTNTTLGTMISITDHNNNNSKIGIVNSVSNDDNYTLKKEVIWATRSSQEENILHALPFPVVEKSKELERLMRHMEKKEKLEQKVDVDYDKLVKKLDGISIEDYGKDNMLGLILTSNNRKLVNHCSFENELIFNLINENEKEKYPHLRIILFKNGYTSVTKIKKYKKSNDSDKCEKMIIKVPSKLKEEILKYEELFTSQRDKFSIEFY